MEPRHRQRIDLICDPIVRQIDMKALWPYLFINGIFNYDDCNVPHWSQDITNPEIIKDIILTTKTRRPYAYYELPGSLRKNLIFSYIPQRKYFHTIFWILTIMNVIIINCAKICLCIKFNVSNSMYPQKHDY